MISLLSCFLFVLYAHFNRLPAGYHIHSLNFLFLSFLVFLLFFIFLLLWIFKGKLPGKFKLNFKSPMALGLTLSNLVQRDVKTFFFFFFENNF